MRSFPLPTAEKYRRALEPSELHELSHDFLHMHLLEPNRALGDVRPRAPWHLRPACDNVADFSEVKNNCVIAAA